MELIHSDGNFKDLRAINRILSFDCEINLQGESDYELILPVDVWEIKKIEIGHIIYISGTEFGGIVNRVKTQDTKVTVCGKTWRGFLNKNIVMPPAGQAYKEVSGRADEAMEEILSSHFGTLYSIAESSIQVKDSFRFDLIGEAIERLLSKKNARLQIEQKENFVSLRAVPIQDWSKTYEFNEDYGVMMTIDHDQSKNINHVVALGGGELENRLVLQAWLLPSGEVTYDEDNSKRPRGRDEYTYKLDYPNAESLEELKESIEKIFAENKATINTEVDFSGAKLVNVELGDVVASRDRLTGIYAKQRIVKKIFKLSSSGMPEIRYEVKEV